MATRYESDKEGASVAEQQYVAYYAHQIRRAEIQAEENLEKLKIKEEETKDREREVVRQKAQLATIGSLAEKQSQQIENLETEAQRHRMETSKVEQQKHEAEKELEKLMKKRREQERLEAEQMALQELRKNFFKDKHDSTGKEVQLKILIFGPTGCGKSTLCNGFRSALLDETYVSHFHAVAAQAETMTKGFKGAKYGKHWIIDMGGIYETKSITNESIRDIASGRVPFYAGLTKNLELEKKRISAPKPGENDVSCVVIVLRAGMTLATELKRQIGVIIGLAGEGVATYHLVLTCLDICDPKFDDPKELPTLFDTPNVQAAVKHVSEETGIPPTSISFVRNYVKESETDMHTNILYLKVLEKIMFDAKEQVENNIMKKLQKQEYKKKKFWQLRK